MPEIARDTLIDGRYRVLRRLGTGGMAEVFLAEDQQLGRNVALKLLHRRFAEDPGFVERFRREAQAAAGLQHQNVVSVYDRGEFEDTYYIAMEYLPGRSLKQLIRDEAPLDPVRAIDIAIQILRAARFAHRRGIIHRDLKPHNVIVDDSGHAKVTDFGIARAGASDMTETGSIMGTAQYLSPEQAQGHAVSARSDLYSVGVVLYEMLTGHVPFDGDSAVTIALKHVSEAPQPPSRFNPKVTPELEQTVLWTLNKDPADRPADAEQLITVLEHCREAIVAGEAGQHTASMAALAAGAAAGMPVEGVQEPQPPPTEEAGSTNGSGELVAVIAPEPEEPEPRRRTWLPWLLGVLVLLLVAGAAAAAYFLSRPKQRIVPHVVGQQVKVARTMLENVGLKGATVRKHSNQAPGIVIDADPSVGSKVDKGSTVTLTVSTGRSNVLVPNVQGESQSAATKALKHRGLKVTRVVPTPSRSIPDAQAIKTSPAANQSVPRGTEVTLYMSTGLPKKAVPGVIGDTAAAASSTLNGAGFDPSTQVEVTGSKPAGTVISQNPGPQSMATVGSTVTIVIAQAPAKATVPFVTGKPTDQAEQQIRAVGLIARVGHREVTSPAKVGTVVTQAPPGGTKRAKGSTVSIVVGTPSSSSTSSSSSTTSTTSTTTSTTSSTAKKKKKGAAGNTTTPANVTKTTPGQ
jgi:beta-lactam-binding protein with PASTA domain/predicted Ser/Thr protein kinase